ncbi:MAG: polyprenol monophosphomannose synthase [Proteobacteria bacterium]|nr:polyprenol monophosphomannose synthase [Pseudomonadota bacterium]
MTRRVLIVTPTYNERDNLEPFVRAALAALSHACVLVVDDASPDGTGRLADTMAAQDSRVKVIHRAGKRGLGSAYLDGFRWALGRDFDVIVQMDTDMSHDPAYLPELLARIEDGTDVVLGSRNVRGGGIEGWGLGRHALSKGGSLYSRLVLGVGIRDLTTGFKAFRREVLERIDLESVRSEGYAFQIELTYRALHHGFRVVEVPITFVDRRVGQSKMSRKVFMEAVWMVWALRFEQLRGKR